MKVESKRDKETCPAYFRASTHLWVGVVLFLVCTFTAIAYAPGLNGPFLLDDFHNLEPLGYGGEVNSVGDAQNFVFGNGSGPTGRPVSMASFLLDDWSWPSTPFNFKKNNLLFHLACGLFAFLCLLRLLPYLQKGQGVTSASWVALFACIIWLVHPMNLSTVLYPVQRMAILAAFFSLLTLYLYLIVRDVPSKSAAMRGLLLFFALLSYVAAVFSKENAVLVAVFIVFLEIYIFGVSWLPKRVVLALKVGFPLSIVLAIIFGLFYFSYDSRAFSGAERLVSQFFALGDYLLKVFFPVVSEFNLMNGEFESLQNRGVFSLGLESILAAAGFVFIIVCLAFGILKKLWVPVVGVCWFFIFHLLESSVVPLEIYFEHRNYLPSIGLSLFVAWAFVSLVKSPVLSILGLSIYVVYLLFVLLILSFTWSNPNLLFLKWEMDEPKSIRAKVTYSSHLESMGFEENAFEHIQLALEINPSSTDLLIRSLKLACKTDSEVAFRDARRTLIDSEKQYTLGVSFTLKRILQSSDNSDGVFCGHLDGGIEVDSLFEAVTSSKGISRRKNEAAQLYVLISDYYAGRGNFSLSYSALERAIGFTPTVDLYLKSATMLASAGLYSHAEDQLEFADQLNSARVLVPKRTRDILRLREKIAQLQE
ncbi:hypothetical protein [Marinobacter salarius]|uniref:hypothetical protein n=1 Tax=Marinobacter salarius TaxID=1420917 RepID=UPI003BAA0186